ncbi:insulinase family protein [Rhodomicrobium sp. R_RK_3]|nr:insulinase family protein [Rhodomicrobium sp. R_RK_3]
MTLLHGFQLEREESVPEIGCLARLYRHERTGAELLSLIGEDENKVFGVSFRTPPADSNGIAHILEHSVLCGSRKYPVKAPFLEMLKGSLKTFLNAMTYPDKTVYPVGSVNLQDFYNLVDVYLDAVFHPRITPDILKQEGWHYELESADAPLIYKGVVFNEMKGSYSSPDDRVSRLSQQSVFPDTIYGIDSGGDPKDIPSLTYETFKSFHERYYHPSNAKFVFYGNDDPERRLEILDGVLSEFSRIEVDSKIGLQPRFNAPRQLQHTLPAGAQEAGEKQARVTLNWMLDEVDDVELNLSLAILNHILVGTHAAPLRKALIDSRLGDDVTGTGLNTGLRQMRFGAGLKGIDEGDSEKVEALVLSTLERLAEDGLDPLTVEASINTIEFRLRENNTGSFPRGISIMLRSLNAWNYDRDPLSPLAWEAPLQMLKTRLASGERVFEDLIRRYLIDNVHRTRVLFTPDPEQSGREAADERAKLDAARAAMSDADVEAVIEETRALKRMQETPDSAEALSRLPMLKLKDLDRKTALIPIDIAERSGARVLTHDLATNGVVYADAGLDLRRLPPDLLPYIGIFRRALLETGAGDLDFVQLSQRIGRVTGGLSAQDFTSTVIGENRGVAWLILRIKTMPDKAAESFAILADVLLSARLGNHERIAQIVNEERAGLESRLVPGGSSIASTRLRASLEEGSWVDEQIGGVSYLNFLRQLAASIKEDGGAALTATLERIRGLLVNRNAMVFNLTADADGLTRVEPDLAGLLARLPSAAPAAYPDWLIPGLPRFEGLTMPAKVNYVAKGESLPKLGYKPGGAAMVASNWLRGGWLWDKVRVQGGAYGAFSSLDLRSGVMTFASYRDPNLMETVAVYDGAGGFLRGVAGNAVDLERAIIGTIGQLDTYRLPDAKGLVSMLRYLAGDSDERQQTIRDEVLNASPADIRGFADALDAVAAHGRTVVLGSEQAIKAANAGLEDRFTLTKVL